MRRNPARTPNYPLRGAMASSQPWALHWLRHFSSSCDRKIMSVFDIHSSYHRRLFPVGTANYPVYIFLPWASYGPLLDTVCHPGCPSKAGEDKKRIHIWLPEINVSFDLIQQVLPVKYAVLRVRAGCRNEFNTAFPQVSLSSLISFLHSFCPPFLLLWFSFFSFPLLVISLLFLASFHSLYSAALTLIIYCLLVVQKWCVNVISIFILIVP